VRILHVISTLDVGGAEMHVLLQVRGQVARGHSVRVAYLLGEGALVADYKEAGAELVGNVGSGPLAPWKLRTHLGWCEVAHSHLLRADFVTAAAAFLFGKGKCLVSGKHNDERALLRPFVSRLHGLIGRIPARTIVLSDHVGRFIAEYGRVPLTSQERVYYGIDPAPFAAAAADSKSRERLRAEFGFGLQDVVFLCVARFAPQKAHEVLIAALAEARKQAPVRLLLVGGDPYGDGEQRARAVARELGVEQDRTCVFAGIRRDVPALLGAADAFVMASRWEGLGLVFLEAMAAGLPVLSTNVSAIPEVVQDGITGQLVPPDNAPALTAAMLQWAGDPDRRQAYGAAGMERVAAKFGLDRMVEQTLAIYADVAG